MKPIKFLIEKTVGTMGLTAVFAVSIAILGIVLLLPHGDAQAFSLELLPDSNVYGDFVVGPGKIELNMMPGDTKTIIMTVSNRLGSDKEFFLIEEDFVGSRDPEQAVVLLGDDRGPYSLKNVLTISDSTVAIPHGSRARIPVTVSIPEDAAPGGMYGSVVIGTVSSNRGDSLDGGSAASSPLVTRIGTLFFVRVAGEAKEEGRLTDFFLRGRKTFLTGGRDIAFGLTFENTGNVHLNPKGDIRVENMLGSSVAEIEVDPWFAMPDSLRFREVAWQPPFLFGRYKAIATIERGYGEGQDEMNISFWVIPWKILAGAFLAIIVIISAIRFVMKRFSLVRK